MIKLLSVLLFASGSVVAWEVHGPVSPTSAEQTAIRELKYYLTTVAGPASDKCSGSGIFCRSYSARIKSAGCRNFC